MRILAPIIYFAYNRPDHTLHTLEALSKCRLAEDSDLYIYIDGPKENASEANKKNIESVKEIAQLKKWCKNVTIIAAEKNKGLFRSITEGISAIVNRFGKIIIVEDDVLVSPGFLEYINDALNIYENTPQVMHISAFSLPEFDDVEVKESTYFYNHTTCWGWGTWKRAWDFFDVDVLSLRERAKKEKSIYHLNMGHTFEFYWGLKAISKGKFQDWNYNWHTSVFLNDGMCLHPTHSLVSNIGHDGSGTNCIDSDQFKNHKYIADKIIVTPIPLVENAAIRKFHKKRIPFKVKFIFFFKHYFKYLVN
jgi:hypothetical protein